MYPEHISIIKSELTRSGYVTYIAILTISLRKVVPLSVVGELKVSKKFKSQKICTSVVGASNIKFNIFAT